jgi:hypothetical protein
MAREQGRGGTRGNAGDGRVGIAPGRTVGPKAFPDLSQPPALDAITREQVAQHAGDLMRGGYT